MTDKEINIKSSTIEKGLDLAKDFLGKLIFPTIEEVGLLIADNVKYLRYKNQVKILLKAKSYVESKKISIKEIPIKILVPLLENSSLEENEELQDKWAKMLVNMANSEKNFQNQIFPFVLSQISNEEFTALKEISILELEHDTIFKKHEEFKSVDKHEFNSETRKLKTKIDEVEQDGFSINLLEFEIANLVRLGLIRLLPPKIYIPEFKTSSSHYDSRDEWHSLDAEYDTYAYGYRITELGKKFVEVCEFEDKQASH